MDGLDRAILWHKENRRLRAIVEKARNRANLPGTLRERRPLLNALEVAEKALQAHVCR